MSDRGNKPRIGERRLVESDTPGYDRVVTIKGRVVANHREFYTVEEIDGALYLAQSLRRPDELRKEDNHE